MVLGISVLDLFKLGTAAAGVLPRPGANIVSQGLASAVAPMLSERRLLIGRNLDRATGRRLTPVRREALTNAAIRSYGRYWEDLLRLPTVSTRELAANFDSQGLHHLDEAVASGTGPILAMPHVGRWEWAAAWLTRVHGVEVTAVVEAIEPPELFDWFRNKREALGIHVVPLGPDAVGSISRAIKAGHVVCLLSDRDISGGGPEVEFFGERTRLPAGPVTLALRTGALLLPTAVYETPGNRVLGVVRPPMDLEREGRLRADVARLTQVLAYELEELIAAQPQQWHLQSPNWPSDVAALRAAGYSPESLPGSAPGHSN
ncbi:phosphatidylinositol mannoside acyltransferase [Candidatus Neomicrothrix sp.]|uniref:phosphatidylinositol mannoside acyltransferase n=1 Tax=Candidatus Neomicrothrix sp. TaxID=2719034 RepID=UPI001B6D131A|nr:phosphatidylinositol mannoside acyltransferase [Candidatus Microthrix sp.]MBK6309949.1 phosphatidylinositol mannoside acyltransferase [Candidatus Microthrix sp.]MBK6439715.1 phosphatidylinositol mannoside acyltransferase [Candidatus Microthrix sp.]MBK6969642.1 phosphatidylinositol mannoside acyltransferase [Candidatus Microthrix sp.]MBK7165038.1 phosphatidylinositol mannoside acyltransferase [Candidatus Microthrix sp.]MBK9560357.1 phosphatidylinositol mannoside acyltransferase [Candidatus M